MRWPRRRITSLSLPQRLIKIRRNVDAQSRELTVREGALHAAQDATTKRKAQLDEEHDKMMKRKALLSEIN